MSNVQSNRSVLSMSSDSVLQTICSNLEKTPARRSLCAELFWEHGPPEYKDAVRQFAAMDPEERWKQLCQTSPELIEQCAPFFVFQARLSSAKKTPLTWIHIMYRNVTTYCDETKKTDRIDDLTSVTRKEPGKLVLKFADNSKLNLHFEEENRFFEMLSRYLDDTQVKLHNFRLLLECMSTWRNPVPHEFYKVIGSTLKLFTQPDYYALRTLVNMRMESTVKQVIGKGLVRCFAYNHTLSFYIGYVAWLYFQKPPPAPELLRGDTILTTSLAGVREVYASHYLDTLVTKMSERVKNATGSDQVAVAFMEVLEETEMPKILQWVCYCIFKEASKAFPEGNGRYNAVSAFFFLRGLFPKIALLEQEDVRKKLMGMSSLTNLISKPETEKFLPRMCKFIESITNANLTDDDLEGNVPIELVRDSLAALEDALATQAESLLKQLPDIVLAGVHPMRWFIDEQVALCQAAAQPRAGAGAQPPTRRSTTIAPPTMKPKPPSGRPTPPSSGNSSAHSSTGPAAKA